MLTVKLDGLGADRETKKTKMVLKKPFWHKDKDKDKVIVKKIPPNPPRRGAAGLPLKNSGQRTQRRSGNRTQRGSSQKPRPWSHWKPC